MLKKNRELLAALQVADLCYRTLAQSNFLVLHKLKPKPCLRSKLIAPKWPLRLVIRIIHIYNWFSSWMRKLMKFLNNYHNALNFMTKLKQHKCRKWLTISIILSKLLRSVLGPTTTASGKRSNNYKRNPMIWMSKDTIRLRYPWNILARLLQNLNQLASSNLKRLISNSKVLNKN